MNLRQVSFLHRQVRNDEDRLAHRRRDNTCSAGRIDPTLLTVMPQAVPRDLTRAEYDATFCAPMNDVTSTAEPVVDIWSYLDAVFACQFADMATDEWDVEYVYQHPTERWLHVLLGTGMENIHLVVVIDLRQPSILGHHLLNLNQRYGLSH